MSQEFKLSRILKDLNDAQRKAVTSPSKGQLQVIAGPGTGKTKVLTSRIAYLLMSEGIDPRNILVTTFTKKAANEMKERLQFLLKGCGVDLNKLLIGTFHSICVKILRIHGHKIGMKNFKIAAERDALGLIDSFLEDITGSLEQLANKDAHNTKIKVKDLKDKNGKYSIKKMRKQISSFKSKGLDVHSYPSDKSHSDEFLLLLQTYEEKLKFHNLLDFDDLLVKTNQLLEKESCLTNLYHVLIDEFQDTNTVQLNLMYNFARQNLRNSNNITIVGDPDQSIYAFRDAVSQNFDLMSKRFPDCKIVKLIQSYRSTQEILDISESFMIQQQDRKNKQLISQFKNGFPPVYKRFKDTNDEAKFIAEEILRLKSFPGLFKSSDFAILVRNASLSRVIEANLSLKKIPYSIVKGRAFWERKEVVLFIDYLRSVVIKNDLPSISRVLLAITPGIGAKSVKSLYQKMENQLRNEVPPLVTLRSIANGGTRISQKLSKKALQGFIDTIDSTIRLYDPTSGKENALSVFDQILTLPAFEEICEDTERKENLEEIRKNLEEFSLQQDDDTLSEHTSFLEEFISSIDLYLIDDSSDVNEDGRVLISTIHAAKGLEWRVVFVPVLIEDVLPSRMVEDMEDLNEERRIFYVSTTRAKNLLYLSSSSRGFNDKPSRFITSRVIKKTERSQSAFANTNNVQNLYGICNIQYPGNVDFKRLIHTYQKEILESSSCELDVEDSYTSENLSFSKGKVQNFQNIPPVKVVPQFAPSYVKTDIVKSSNLLKSKQIDTGSLKNLYSISNPVKQPLTSSSTGSLTVNIDTRLSEPSTGPKKKRTLGIKRRRPMQAIVNQNSNVHG